MSEEISPETKIAIKKQIEFYFSDENLPRDKFLQAECKKTPEGWIDISVLTTFKKLAALSKDVPVIADAISDSELLVLSEDKTKVRRKTSAPSQEELDNRTLYIKGLPKEATLEELIQFFEKYGQIGAIRMRRDLQSKEFTGSAFVVFKVKDECDKFASLDPVPVYGESTLERMTIEQFRKVEGEPVRHVNEKRRLKEERQKAEAEEREKRRKEIENDRENYQKGILLSFIFNSPTSSLSLIALKDFFGHFGEIARVDFDEKEDSFVGLARYRTPEGCQQANQALQESAAAETPVHTLNGSAPIVKILDGEEEKKEWENIVDRRLKAMERKEEQQKAGKGRFGRGRGRGGRGRGRGRGNRRNNMGDEDEDEEGKSHKAAKGAGTRTVIASEDDE
ncbi:putative La domain-containing protein [Monocercomonoides exilis]|uniref:putative La domain-containing protein n=1 Tax=Monocercomonoides exilis TaxID=2049356 RepID=UPI0035594155|nr:putative La domain-containing protein [Monocercomonoides exilis]|eukprot:MONOS_7305.1-p1 / transcript=MONOS_7305.1 / gene=MONOS_7305 / organism=Monocercomonoides_exilis_PA203 / gene_product=La domain-containing protein / transcript_product=La domain-containing protein / location=Mono_scaffold00247:29021-31133(+) / protein_length=393 / sequence_SO=supercontig / SO=protein_coding / is_pseudo=false